MKRLILVCIALVAFVSVVFPQPPTAKWESKDVDKWDRADVLAVLEGSAWGRVFRAKPSAPIPGVGTVIGDTRVKFSLRSSLPIRLALVRGEQIVQNYDAMSPEKKAKFDQQNRSILTCSLCDKFYIISISADSEMLRKAPLIKSRSAGITLSNEAGERRTLKNFTPQVEQGGEALFFFSRFDAQGKPLFTTANSKLIFNLREDVNDDAAISLLRRIEIDIKDIVRENQVLF